MWTIKYVHHFNMRKSGKFSLSGKMERGRENNKYLGYCYTKCNIMRCMRLKASATLLSLRILNVSSFAYTGFIMIKRWINLNFCLWMYMWVDGGHILRLFELYRLSQKSLTHLLFYIFVWNALYFWIVCEKWDTVYYTPPIVKYYASRRISIFRKWEGTRK